MRLIWRLLAWVFVLGAVINLAIFAHALIALGPDSTVGEYLARAPDILSWTNVALDFLAPEDLARALRQAPVATFFPARAVGAIVLAALFFWLGRKRA